MGTRLKFSEKKYYNINKRQELIAKNLNLRTYSQELFCLITQVDWVCRNDHNHLLVFDPDNPSYTYEVGEAINMPRCIEEPDAKCPAIDGDEYNFVGDGVSYVAHIMRLQYIF